MNKDRCLEFSSETLLELLSRLNKNLGRNLTSYMIGNMITAAQTNLATPLQIALAVLLRGSKEQVKVLFDFGVTCSYDELLCFKRSVAVAANNSLDLAGLLVDTTEMIQGNGDNFDQEIASQNGKI